MENKFNTQENERKPTELEVGMTVELLQSGDVLDTLTVTNIASTTEITLQSVDLPQLVEDFASFTLGNTRVWRMLFEDPMTGKRCFSERAPVYTIHPII
ncbi:MAG: hypothetical protein AAB395_01155 [Patescibacteria group bacterium]